MLAQDAIIDLNRSVLNGNKWITKLVVRDDVAWMEDSFFRRSKYGTVRDELSLCHPTIFESKRDFVVSVEMSPRTKRIYPGSFFYCRSLCFLEIPDGVEEIEGIFCFCPSLQAVMLPASFKLIRENEFDKCDALQFIFIEAKDEDDFNRIKLLLPPHVQSKAIFGKDLWNDILQIRKKTLQECMIGSSELSKTCFNQGSKRNVDFSEGSREVHSFLEDDSVMNLIHAVRFPIYNINPDDFLSRYEKILNDFKNRYIFACNIKSFSVSIKDRERRFLEDILQKVENYNVKLHFSIPERILILRHDFLFSAFRLLMKDNINMTQELHDLLNHARPELLSVVIRTLSTPLLDWGWLTHHDSFEKTIRHPELKQLAHFFSDTQWREEKEELVADVFKKDYLLSQERPFNFILSYFFWTDFRSKKKENPLLFSGSDKENNEAAFLEILSLFEACISLDIPYKKETILSIKESIIKGPISSLQNLSALVKNLRRLQEQVKNQPLDTNSPLSILLEHLKKSDVNKILPALCGASFSGSPEECRACNDDIERADRRSGNYLR